MKPSEHDERNWEASRHVVDVAGPIPPDEQLTAYRDGRLPEGQARDLERVLAASAASRRRLTELGGVVIDSPPSHLRQEVLKPERSGAKSQRPSWRYWIAAAAVLAVASILVVKLGGIAPAVDQPRVIAALQGGVTFDIQISALADRRSDATTNLALADSIVRVVMQQRGEALSGIDFGLYRLESGRLSRLAAADGLITQINRGAVEWRVIASALVGTSPGRHPFYLAVGPQGALPTEVTPAVGELPEQRLAAASRGLAFESTLEIVAPPEPGKE